VARLRQRRRIRQTLAADSDAQAELRRSARVRTAVVIGVVLAVFQQWCGINVIFNYAEEIFVGRAASQTSSTS
jgi:SP family sugar porter-like MFS transporter